MKVEEIERLLTEFYEGNTTESQEEALRDYFRTTEVPEHLQRIKKFFLALTRVQIEMWKFLRAWGIN